MSVVDSSSVCVRDWKYLHKHFFIIWVINTKSSLVKLQKIISTNNLPMHALFFIKKKRNYTIDYSPIEKEFQKLFTDQSNPT